MGDTWLFNEKNERINQRAGHHTTQGTEKITVLLSFLKYP
jgi:hypothetical protein